MKTAPRRPDLAIDLARYPLVMGKSDMAAIFGRSLRWVEQQVAAGTFPIPRLASMAKPAWGKGDVRRFLEQRTFLPPSSSSSSSTPSSSGKQVA